MNKNPWSYTYCVLNLCVMIVLLCMFIHKCEETRKLRELLDARTETVDEQNRIIHKLLTIRGITDAN